MSWNITHTGPAKDAPSRHERAAEAALPGRNGYEQTAIKATVPLVEIAVKHAHLTDYHADVSASGHHNLDGTGSVQVKVAIYVPVPPAPEPPVEG